MTEERWRPVPGFEGHYEVSDRGNVRSIDRLVRRGDHHQWCWGRNLATTAGEWGHLWVHFYRDHVQYHRGVHRLVLEAFVGPCPDGMECCHNNGDSADNRLENLRWDTSSANKLDNVRNGSHAQAKKTHCPHGHEYTPENTYLVVSKRSKHRGTRRQCRTCTRERAARQYEAQRLARRAA